MAKYLVPPSFANYEQEGGTVCEDQARREPPYLPFDSLSIADETVGAEDHLTWEHVPHPSGSPNCVSRT